MKRSKAEAVYDWKQLPRQHTSTVVKVLMKAIPISHPGKHATKAFCLGAPASIGEKSAWSTCMVSLVAIIVIQNTKIYMFVPTKVLK